jgi:RNA methyltransferase, TrmH family
MDSVPPLSQEKRRLLLSLLSRRLRERRGLVLVEGEKNLAEAAARGLLRFLAVRREEGGGELAAHARGLAARWGAGLFALDPEGWEQVSAVVSSPGLLGVADQPAPGELAAFSAAPSSRLLLLDAVQDPGNVGGLLRSAWALGFDGALLGAGTADPFSPKAVRASSGGVFHLPLLRGAGEGEVRALLAAGTVLYLAAGERGGPGEKPERAGAGEWDRVKWAPRALLALGNEGAGLSPGLRALPAVRVFIPMREGADSLNVLAAGSIIMAALSRRG